MPSNTPGRDLDSTEYTLQVHRANTLSSLNSNFIPSNSIMVCIFIQSLYKDDRLYISKMPCLKPDCNMDTICIHNEIKQEVCFFSPNYVDLVSVLQRSYHENGILYIQVVFSE